MLRSLISTYFLLLVGDLLFLWKVLELSFSTTTATKIIIKCLGINLTKTVRDLYKEIFQNSVEGQKMKKDRNNEKAYHVF